MAATNRIALPHGPYAGVLRARTWHNWRALAVLLTAVATTASTVVVAAGMGDGAGTTAQRVLAATAGPDLVVSALPGVDLRPLMSSPGVSASSGPFPVADTSIRHRGKEAGVWLEGRPRASSLVDRPLLVAGSWLRPGTIVLEQKLATRLGLRPGDRIQVTTVTGRRALLVSGIAATVASRRHPSSSDGLAYVLPKTLATVVPERAPHGSALLMRVSDNRRSEALVAQIKARYPGAQVTVDDFSALRGK
jgi:hypothetical protein